MKQRFFLFLTLTTMLLSSCGNKLDNMLAKAEKTARKGNRVKALQHYNKIATELAKSAPDYLGYDFEKDKAYTLLWNSVESNLTNEQRIRFVNSHITKSSSHNYFKNTKEILRYAVNSSFSDSVKSIILNDYVSHIKAKNYNQRESLSEIVSLIASASIEDEREKLKIIATIYSTIDTSAISSRVFTDQDPRCEDTVPNYTSAEQLLNSMFRDSLLSLLTFDTIEIKPTPEEISSLQDTFQLFPLIDSIPFRKDNQIHLAKCVPVLLSPQKSVLFTVSSFYFALPEEYQAKSFDEIEQILIIKPIRIQIGEYGGIVTSALPAYDRKVGIYHYDVSKRKVVDAQTINCGKLLKTITLRTTFSERLGAFPSQEIVSYLQGVADSSIISSDLHLQIAFEQFINGMPQSASFEKRIKDLGLSRLGE